MKSANVFRALAFGDIIGDSGRQALYNSLQKIIRRYEPDTVIVNGENADQGFGINNGIVNEFFNLGVNAITSGNHIWHRKETFDFIDKYPELLRPINYPPNVPGHGSVVLQSNSIKYGVISAMGRIFMEAIDCPFQVVEKEVEKMKRDGINIILIDFHAEATSEKQVFAHVFDGKISAVWGTHTHVQTADETILPGKTAYITDVGMCGCTDAVIGMKTAESVRRAVMHLPVRFSPADDGPIEIQGVVIDIDKETGKAVLITRIKEEVGFAQRKKK